jgi:formate--tetrahydrofolate ligase
MISNLLEQLDVPERYVHPYGTFAAKLDPALLEEPRKRENPNRLVLVSAITPTPAGEGKTTTTIGLGDAMTQRGASVCLALREPSLGPCFGMKGGGTGGGKAQLTPSDRINLHFTGDFHAITSAHNLLAAALDNHLHFDGPLDIEARKVLWKRVLDMNDRSLRNITVGLGGKIHGVPRETGFDITAASELMAILCLAETADDLQERIDRIIVGLNRSGEPVLAKELKVTGAMMALLADARMPNLAQTSEGTPAMVHGGPFANIAHGCNSVLATRTAMHLADWTVTEAGFGFDLGAEKFFDIKCRSAGINPSAVVLVATARALKMHGGVAVKELGASDPEAVKRGLGNLEKHVESIGKFGARPVIAINRFPTDTEEELDVIKAHCAANDLPCAEAKHFAEGGAGALELADLVMQNAEHDPGPPQTLYELTHSIQEKVGRVARAMYGAREVLFSPKAEKDIAQVERMGLDQLPICIAKTHSSLSDDPKRTGRPTEFDITVRGLEINAGAGFLVVLTGDLMRMPGLPRSPQAERIYFADGSVQGLQ